MLFAGQVTVTAENGSLSAEVWRVRREREPDEKEWTPGKFGFARRPSQAVIYEGKKTESKVSRE